MKITWFVVVSLMTSCALCAPSGRSNDRDPFGRRESPMDQFKQIEEEELAAKLKYIVQKAELELEKMELAAETIQSKSGHQIPRPFTPEEMLLLSKFKEEGSDSRALGGIDYSKLLIDGKREQDNSPTLEQLLLLQKLMDKRNQESDGIVESEDELSGPREMTTEQKLLEVKLLQKVILSYEELMKLAELRAQRSGRSTLQELILLQSHSSHMDFSRLLLEDKHQQDSSSALKQLLLLQKLMDIKNQESDDTEETDEEISRPREMSPEQKFLEEKLVRKIVLTHEELLRLAELRSQRSRRSTLEELILLQQFSRSNTDLAKLFLGELYPRKSSPTIEQLLLLQKLVEKRDEQSTDDEENDQELSRPREMSMEQEFLEVQLAKKVVLSHIQILRLAELRARRSGRSTLEELLLLQRQTSSQVDLSKLFLDGKLPRESYPTAEQLLLLKKLVERRSDDTPEPEPEETVETSAQMSGPREMSNEQKLLEAQLIQKVVLTFEQLLKLAEFRSERSGRTTLEELMLLHQASGNLSPEKIMLMKAVTPVQLAKYFFLQSDSSRGLLGSMIDKLTDLAHAKLVLENSEVYLMNLLKNHQRSDRMSLSEIYLIYSYQESMSHSLDRSRFLLELYLANMTSRLGDAAGPVDQQKLFAATLLERMLQQRDSMWMKEEAILLRRFSSGKASLAETVLAYRELDAMTNSGIGSDLRSYVMNMIRMQMMNGSGMAMMNTGAWMKGWMNNMEFMEASDSERVNEMWDLFKLKYARSYTDRSEERRRRRNFERKLSEIVMHNIEVRLGRAFFTMGLNHLSDWTDEELSDIKGYKTIAVQDEAAQKQDVLEGETTQVVLPNMPTYTNTVPVTSLPPAVNWSSTPWVGPVQDQYQCGSCWSFSACGALEAQYYNKTKTFVTLSEQNLVDCTYSLGNLGCSGGNVAIAFDYVMTVGIDTNASYPYTGRANNGVCKYNADTSVTQDSGWMYIPEGDELALQQAVALVGPVSAAIDASQPSFDSYISGVYSSVNCSSTQLDHAILVVGYGTTSDGQDYWLIKNSWGVDWGMNGYMMMERNVNMCGIATSALFPLIN